MERDAFLKTMIEVLEDNNSFNETRDREQLIRLLGRSRINFVPQYKFSNHGRSGQRWEIVELRVPVPLLDTADEHFQELNSLAGFVYEKSADYAFQNIEIKPLVINTTEEVTDYDVVFDNIQNKIIQGIRDAKFIIWAAVAWFTNGVIYQELLSKQAQGLCIRIVVSDEDQNKTMIHKLRENGFSVAVIPQWGHYNRMHDKFCIIDMDYVMHGSYNWTSTANHNKETWATAVDRELVSKFATEFMHLYNAGKNNTLIYPIE